MIFRVLAIISYAICIVATDNKYVKFLGVLAIAMLIKALLRRKGE